MNVRWIYVLDEFIKNKISICSGYIYIFKCFSLFFLGDFIVLIYGLYVRVCLEFKKKSFYLSFDKIKFDFVAYISYN